MRKHLFKLDLAVPGIALICALLSAASTANAQSRSLLIRVRVVDSAGVGVAGAEVAVMRGLKDALAHGATTGVGLAALIVPRGDGDYSIMVRKIGFNRADRFFKLGDLDTMTFTVPLQRTAATLPAVVTTAEEDLRRKSYHLDADDILNSARPIVDGMDIFKLRPDMLSSRGGHQACELPLFKNDPSPHTGWAENIWVNGRRIRLVPLDPRAVRRKSAVGLDPHTFAPQLDTVMTVLASIKAEHIAEVTYHDCFGSPVNRTFTDMAIFVTLKPGIGFEPGVGSYVVKEAPTDADGVPLYRRRVLGVYDEATGSPLAGVAVADTLSGLRSLTSATGTLSLFFLRDGGAPIRVHKDGYADTAFVAKISPRDTLPITIVLRPVKQP